MKTRYNKAANAEAQAASNLGKVRVFYVAGKVQAGDNVNAQIYGTATQVAGEGGGAGSINEKNFLAVNSPVDSEYRGDSYLGYCTFLGVVNGRNTYLPVAKQKDYVSAYNEAEKWRTLTASIQAEINAVYLPYRQKENVQKQKQEREQERVTQAQQRLAQARHEVEAAKQSRINQQQENAELARIEAETTKAKADQALIEAQTKKEQDELARQKARQLEETAKRNQAAIEILKDTPSIIAGQQLGKVQLGMSEAEVLQAMGAPASSIQLRKPAPLGMGQYDVKFLPSRFRRDRYFLNATDGFDIRYEGSNEELGVLAKERGLTPVRQGDLKTRFIFDVIYLDGNVVQIESDSPEFFTPDKKNIMSADWLESTAGAYTSHEPVGVYPPTDQQRTDYSYYGNFYVGNRMEGLSTCLEFMQDKNTAAFPASRMKVIVHRSNTLPFTGDCQYGIRLWDTKQGTYKEQEENSEERFRWSLPR